MPIELKEELGGKVLEITATGRLTKEDYKKFTPEFERLVQEHARISILFIMKDFHGWDFRGFWEDLKFESKHYSDIKRVAMVGDKNWEKAMATLCVPFTAASVKYFEFSEMEQARSWVFEAEVLPTPVR